MLHKHTFRRAVIAALLLVALLLQATWTLAGTTGGLSGQVTDEHGAPIAGATVTVAAPSETVSATTDAGGHYAFLSLAPDTYTLTVIKSGYTNASYPGITVFADQNQTVPVQMSRTLKQIANITAKAQGSLVKAGTTVDVYAVNATTAGQLQSLGGGNNLNSAYSAIYSQPGVNPLPGNYGLTQVYYIHGSSYNQIGYEFDGIPVNRAFDNYPTSSLSNLGAISTEVYTGGGPAAATSPTLGGYINQVIKTGTFPGYATLSGGVGTPGFYHFAQVEAGGATPDRNFSWYAGLRGDNMIPNQFDSQNGDDLNPDGSNQYGVQGPTFNALLFPFEQFGFAASRGPWSTCANGYQTPSGGSYLSPYLASDYGLPAGTRLPTCSAYAPLLATNTVALRGNDLTDRESVVNFHIGVPHRKDAGRDDIQILYDNYYYLTQAWDNNSTNGGLPYLEDVTTNVAGVSGKGYYNSFLEHFFGPGNYLGTAAMPQYPGYCGYFNFWAALGRSLPCPSTGSSPFPWGDAYIVQGATFGQSAVGATGIVKPYFFPSSPTDRAFGSGISNYATSSTTNNGSIVKLQYTKNFSSSAYLRVYGYTFYSDWFVNDANAGNFDVAPFAIGGVGQADYEVDAHTRGLDLTFADQLGAQNLLTLTGNYTTASLSRWNNSQNTFTPVGTPIATLMKGNTCYSAYANAEWDGSYSKNLPIGSPVSCLSPLAGAVINQVTSGALPAITGNAATAGATWQLTQNLQPDGNLSTVSPRFATIALQDEFRPSDRWDINVGARLESYGYVLGDYQNPESEFWFNQINSTVCVDPNGLVQASSNDFIPTGARNPAVPSAYPTFYTTLPGQPCKFDPILNAQLYHPGQHGIPAISFGETGTLTKVTSSPRVGFTYTVDPNAVIRFSYGRYTQPTPTAFEQVLTYLDGYQMATNLYSSKYYNVGLPSLVHDNPIQYSNNFDASYEQRLRGTDWSFKISPFYRYTSDQSVTISLPGGLGGAFNAGTQKSQGVELAIQKGDPAQNGFSGQLSYTYTWARIKYSLIDGSNIVSTLDSNLTTFWGLTKNGGGSRCYLGGKASPCSATGAITNPYYNLLPNVKSVDQLLAPFPIDGWYPTFANEFPYGLQLGDASSALSPSIFSGLLSYRRNKFQVALTGELWQGTSYGAPTDILGIDPRTCGANQGQSGIVPGSHLADYQSCGGTVAMPNPFTGQFDTVGQYREPWQFNLGAQVSYDISSRVTATVALANIFNQCFGGSAEPWTAAYPPNHIICGYFPSSAYLGWSPGEVWNTAGAGYFYGNSPHAAVNGTTGYPKVFDQAYAPGAVQIPSPFQAYFQVNVKM